ncbi:MAG: lysophospholipid acyltransferase family protein [Myxococcota bacterium]
MGDPNRPARAAQQQCDADGEAQPQASKKASEGSPLRRLGLLAFGTFSGLLLRVLGSTWRIEQIGQDPRPTEGQSADEPAAELAAFFHESLLPAAWFYRDRGYSAAVSRSRDGDLVGATLRALGYAPPARGSSSRGGSAALLGLLRLLEQGTTVSVLVDGPRGPARISKPGIIALSRMAKRPIQPVAFAARPALRLRSWDQSLIPLPFARVVCAYGEPHKPTDEAATPAEGDIEAAGALALDESLLALRDAAEARLNQS